MSSHVRTVLTMLSRLQDLLRKLVVSFAGSTDNHKLNLRICENLIKVVVDFHTLGSIGSKAGSELSAWGSGLAFEHSVKLEVLRERKDERNVEGESCETNTEDGSLDGLE